MSKEVFVFDDILYDRELIDRVRDTEFYTKINQKTIKLSSDLLYNLDNDSFQILIYLMPQAIDYINFDNCTDFMKKVLKKRFDAFFENKNKYDVENIKKFYKSISYIRLRFNGNSIFKFALEASDEDYEKYNSCYLIAPLFQEVRNNPTWYKNTELIKALLKYDFESYKYFPKEYEASKEFIECLLEYVNTEKDDDNDVFAYYVKKSLIDEEVLLDYLNDELASDVELNKKMIDKFRFYSVKNGWREGTYVYTDKCKYLEMFKNNKNINTNKDLICSLILKTPKSFKYFDRSLIDKEMVKYLLDSFKENHYYEKFYSDYRFYKFAYKYDCSEYGKLEIVKVISSFFPLNKKGNSYVGECPFHPDNNPSFYVYPKKQRFACYVCRVKGNVHHFLNMMNAYDVYFGGLTYKNPLKNRFPYYLYVNLPDDLKRDKGIIKMFLNIDGCILKLVPKDLRYDGELVDIAFKQDITSFRYIMDNEDLKKKYVTRYPILNYYLKNDEKSDGFKEIFNKINNR